MKKKFLTKVLMGALCGTMIFSAAACGAPTALAYDGNENSATYNQNLFYRNDLVTTAPDPSVIAVKDADGVYSYYMYATSSEIETTGYLVWKSSDMNNWKCLGTAFMPERESWSLRNVWAPEVLAYEGKYYMVYSAGNYQKRNGRLSLGIAVSDTPEGPFVQWTGTNLDGRTVAINESFVDTDLFPQDHELYQTHLIDASLFVDDDGQIYLYFVRDVRDSASGSAIWGMKMKDFFTPDYSTAKKLAQNKKSSPDNLTNDIPASDEDYTNEGPFMIKENGVYYLTLSVNEFWTKQYSVKQAIADAPLGDFVKVANDDGGKILTAIEDDKSYVDENGEEIIIDNYDQMSGTGHHCFVKIENEWWIVYHGHKDRLYGNSDRGSAIDKVMFTQNKAGQRVLYVNGPTWSVQPLPEEVTGYKNVALDAEVTATNMRTSSSLAYLNDGLVRMHNNSLAQEFIAEKTTEVTLTWEDYVSVRSLLVYNSFYYDKLWDSVENIVFYTDKDVVGTDSVTIDALTYDREWHVDEDYSFVRAGGAAIGEFNEIPVNKITFTIKSDSALAISDIVVLGKEDTKSKANINSYSYTNPEKDANPNSWRDIKGLNDGITIDGVLDEAAWANNNWFEFDSVYSDVYSLKMTSYFGNDGIYFAVDVDDPLVSYNNTKPVYQNSSVEIMIAPKGLYKRNEDCVQVRIAASGKVETWVGVSSGYNENDYYDYSSHYFPTYVRTQGKGFDVEYMQDKVVADNVEGYVIECYVPYKEIGLDSKPLEVGVLPTFNTVTSYSSTNRTSNCPDNLSYNNVSAYFTFTSKGYVPAEEGESFGNGLNYDMTMGFDASKDSGSTPYITQKGAEQQYIFLKDFHETKYSFTAKMTALEIMNNDGYPKFGLIAAYTPSQSYAFVVDAIGFKADASTMAIVGKLGTGDWDWGNYMMQSVLTGSYTGINSVELSVIRDGADFYFFVNGKFAGRQSDINGLGADVAAEIGFITMNAATRFFDYSVTTDSDLIDEKINSITASLYGDNLGNSASGTLASSGFSLTYDKGTADAYTVQSGVDQQYIFFKNLNATTYMIQAKITATAVLNQDSAPKMGLIAAEKDKRVLSLFLEPAALQADRTLMTVTGILGTGDWTWGSMYYMGSVKSGSYTGDSYVTMTVIREGATFSYYMNNVCAGIQSDVDGFGADVATSAGFMTMNIAAKYFGYSATTDRAQIDAFKAQADAGDTDSVFGASHNNLVGNTAGFTESETALVQNGAEQQFTFFNGFYASDFTAQVTINVSQVYNNDAFPRIGLILCNGKQTVFFQLCVTDLSPDATSGIVTGEIGTSNWAWGDMTNFTSVKAGSYTGTDTVTMGVQKTGATLIFFLNGQEVGRLTDVTSFGAADKCSVGFCTMNVGATFTQWSCVAAQ